VIRKKSRWMDRTAFYIGKREFAHFHSNQEIDVRLTRNYQQEYSGKLEDDRRVKFRERPSEWISTRFATTGDVDFAFSIVSLALRANRA
jgi:luciferase-like monooxygenase